MKLTDPAAIKALKSVRCCELEDMLADYPDDMRMGRSDWDMIANEAGWLLDAFNSDDTVHNDDLEDAKRILRIFRSRRMVYWSDGRPMYKGLDYQRARNTVNEYNRLTRFVQKLKAMGLYCPYC